MRFWLSTMVFGLLLLFTSGCGEQKQESLPHGERPRLISLAPSITEILQALDAADELVGITRFCPWDSSQWGQQPQRLGNMQNPSLENILLLRPDQVLGSAFLGPASQLAIESRGIPCPVFLHQGMEGLIDDIERLGEISGKEDGARELVERLRNTRIHPHSDEKMPLALILYGVHPFYAAGSGSFAGEYLEWAGAQNATENTHSAWPELSGESLIKIDPDVIFIAVEGNDPSKKRASLLASMEKIPEWRLVRAYQQKSIYLIPNDDLTVPGPRALKTIPRLAATLGTGDLSAKSYSPLFDEGSP